VSLRYAEGTSVRVEQSQTEIRALLSKHGVKHFAYAEEPTRAAIQFSLHGLPYRFEVVKPTISDIRSRFRTNAGWDDRIEKEWRRRWRARLLWLRATLEFAADEGPDAVSQALLAYLVLPGGTTMGQWADKQLPDAYRDGAMPPLMIGDGR
jgi:hypothetical protein